MKKTINIFKALVLILGLAIGSLSYNNADADSLDSSIYRARFYPVICGDGQGNLWAACEAPDPTGPCFRQTECDDGPPVIK